MRAARIHRYGPPEVLQIDDVPEPAPGPRDVLIEVHGSSVNPVDWKIRSGGQRALIHYTLPWILGLDVSGVVRAIGSNVTRFRVGDEVISSPTHRRPGTWADQVAIDERAVARKPRNMSHVEAGSLPLVALTAWDALVLRGRLAKGQKALIHAGAGGVGHVAIQLAKELGAYVATTCSERNAAFVRELGADEVIDYKTQRFDEVLRDYDLVLDALGGEERERSLKILKPGGHLATMIGGFPEEAEKRGPALGAVVAIGTLASITLRAELVRGIKMHHVLRESNGEILEQIVRRVEAGAIRVVLDSTHPLEKIVDAHHASEAGRARGKIAIAVR